MLYLAMRHDRSSYAILSGHLGAPQPPTHTQIRFCASVDA
jgi:hypothetical protein